jgi:hypothetical protein
MRRAIGRRVDDTVSRCTVGEWLSAPVAIPRSGGATNYKSMVRRDISGARSRTQRSVNRSTIVLMIKELLAGGSSAAERVVGAVGGARPGRGLPYQRSCNRHPNAGHQESYGTRLRRQALRKMGTPASSRGAEGHSYRLAMNLATRRRKARGMLL